MMRSDRIAGRQPALRIGGCEQQTRDESELQANLVDGKENDMSVVICKLPKAGLGNQLFPLMKAQLFAYLFNLPILVIGYRQVKIGPYLRNAKVKRNYNNYFRFQKNIFQCLSTEVRLLTKRKSSWINEPVFNGESMHASDSVFYFGEIPHWRDYFDVLRENRKLTMKLFYDIVCDDFMKQANEHTPPCVGVHIRMGDYRKLQADEDFKKVGLVRTPQEYFMGVINAIRKIHGTCLPVTVFTDGYREELEELFSLKNISMAEGNPDIVDMLLLSKSRIIVASAGSTFGYWAGFLSDAILILHPDHIHKPIRRSSQCEHLYEGPLDLRNQLLVDNIRSIQFG